MKRKLFTLVRDEAFPHGADVAACNVSYSHSHMHRDDLIMLISTHPPFSQSIKGTWYFCLNLTQLKLFGFFDSGNGKYFQSLFKAVKP